MSIYWSFRKCACRPNWTLPVLACRYRQREDFEIYNNSIIAYIFLSWFVFNTFYFEIITDILFANVVSFFLSLPLLGSAPPFVHSALNCVHTLWDAHLELYSWGERPFNSQISKLQNNFGETQNFKYLKYHKPVQIGLISEIKS